MSELLQAAEELGKDIKAFLDTPVGKYIDGCTQQDIENAKNELIDLDPYAESTLAELQNRISKIQLRAKTAMYLRDYLAEAIVNANQAIHQLENEGQD